MKRVNYMQVVPQTDEEKLRMYMKMPKKKIAEMLVNCNRLLEQIQPTVTVGDVFADRWIDAKPTPQEAK